jgi:hypothetical protein
MARKCLWSNYWSREHFLRETFPGSSEIRSWGKLWVLSTVIRILVHRMTDKRGCLDDFKRFPSQTAPVQPIPLAKRAELGRGLVDVMGSTFLHLPLHPEGFIDRATPFVPLPRGNQFYFPVLHWGHLVRPPSTSDEGRSPSSQGLKGLL